MSQVWGENGEDGYGFNVGLIIFVYEQGFKDYKDYIDYHRFFDSPILHWDYSIRCLCVVYGFLVENQQLTPINTMKRIIAFLSTAFLWGALLFTSCSSEMKTEVTIYDGETEWPSIMDTHIMVGNTEAGKVDIWAPSFMTEIGNSLRGVTIMIKTSEPGVYTGTYDFTNEKWSNDAIGVLTMTVDYDGQAYPRWYASSATVTIYDYDDDAKLITATIEAIMVEEGTTNTRNIKVEMKNLDVSGQKENQ